MSAKPSISVVLIVFNGENFLAEAIDSVVNQSFEDWELVVADDGSTDGTSDMLKKIVSDLRTAYGLNVPTELDVKD